MVEAAITKVVVVVEINHIHHLSKRMIITLRRMKEEVSDLKKLLTIQEATRGKSQNKNKNTESQRTRTAHQ